MIIQFDEYYPRNDYGDNLIDDINNAINETLSISTETTHMSNVLTRYLKRNMKQLMKPAAYKAKQYGYLAINGIDADIYFISKLVTLNSITFILQIDVINLNNSSENILRDVSLRYLRLKCRRGIPSNGMETFIIEGSIPLLNMQMTTEIESVISHELAHAWNNFNSGPTNTKGNVQWKSIYKKAVTLINDIQSQRYIGKLDRDILKKICYAVYISDIGEIAAFTQQAYILKRNCTDFGEIDKIIHNSELYKLTKNLKEVIDIFKNEDCSKYAETLGTTQHRLLKIFEKRYAKCITNLGKLTVVRKDMIESYFGMIPTIEDYFLKPLFD